MAHPTFFGVPIFNSTPSSKRLGDTRPDLTGRCGTTCVAPRTPAWVQAGTRSPGLRRPPMPRCTPARAACGCVCVRCRGRSAAWWPRPSPSATCCREAGRGSPRRREPDSGRQIRGHPRPRAAAQRGEGDGAAATWSPDGSQIASVRFENAPTNSLEYDDSDLWVMRADGSGQHRILEAERPLDVLPVASAGDDLGPGGPGG